MNRYVPHLLTLLAVNVLLACGSGDSEQQPPLGANAATAQPIPNDYRGFPKGYDYLVDPKGLEEAAAAGNRHWVRKHAWYLWAGIMQPEPSGWPLWITWPNTSQAFTRKTPGMTGATTLSDLAVLNRHSEVIGECVISPLEMPTTVPGECRPSYRLPDWFWKVHDPKKVKCGKGICDGKTFANNGDILIPTISLSKEALTTIRTEGLYEKDELNQRHARGEAGIELEDSYIVTKHIYWPVKAKGFSALPVWNGNYERTVEGYAGIEYWNTIVAISAAQTDVKTGDVEFMFDVMDRERDGERSPLPTKKIKDAKVYDVSKFYAHKVTKDDWLIRFDAGDRAILDAASHWAHGQSFEVGDYLVTVAMHVNTFEIPRWALQSVWWSDDPDASELAKDRPEMPHGTEGPWNHYLLTDSYRIPAPSNSTSLPVAMNPYIELDLHPERTNCQNCHVRAGWPRSADATPGASYENPNCRDALMLLNPGDDCFKGLMLTEFQWIIPDRAL